MTWFKPLSGSRRRRRFLLLLVLPLALACGGLALLLQPRALVGPLPAPSIGDALRTRTLALRVLNDLESDQQTVNLHASAEELRSLLTLAGRGLPRFAGRVDLSPRQARIAISLRLLPAGFPGYLNLQADILPSQGGLSIGDASVGHLPFSGPLALWFTRLALDLGFGQGESSAVLASLKRLEFTEQQVRFELGELPQLKKRLGRLLARLSALHDLAPSFAPPWIPAKVRLYAERLEEITAQLPARPAPQLTSYLGPLFTLARENSRKGDPVQENQAALLALAGYLGDWRIVDLIEQDALHLPPRLTPPPEQVLLAGRDDLRRHFVISIGLQLLTEQRLTATIGELKEMLDAAQGGSGFSFVDLAADLAGSALARTASDPGRARKLQRLLAESSEEAGFFPRIEGLPENLSQAEFEARFGAIDSPAYLQLLEEIERRLAACAVHRK